MRCNSCITSVQFLNFSVRFMAISGRCIVLSAQLIVVQNRIETNRRNPRPSNSPSIPEPDSVILTGPQSRAH